MDIVNGHLCFDEARMCSISENIGVLGGEMSREVAGVEDCCQLRTAVLPIGSIILIQLFQRLEFAVRRCSLVSIGSEVDDADGRAGRGGFLQDGEEVRCEDYVGHVVHCHLEKLSKGRTSSGSHIHGGRHHSL